MLDTGLEALSNSEQDNQSFPLGDLLPKNETQTTYFLSKYPKFDGRDVLIAILDTGIDPGAPGLQVTSTGSCKIINIMDCTGAGDIDTSTIRTLDEKGKIVGLTGRKLKIPESWSNPSGKYHVGMKNLFELYPSDLKDRVKKERREKTWDLLHRLCVSDLSRQLDLFDEEIGSDSKELEDKWKGEDLLHLTDCLKSLDENYDDCGPVMDCIVFHDGKTWRACVDTSFKGNLDKCQLLGSYGETREFARFTEQDLLSYSVNFHDNGNILEIACTSGSHGTHVASIAAANFPDNQERNGLAPGAQIVSLCIGDSRLNKMETGAALTRAINTCIEMKVDVINYSYSEGVHFKEFGPICKAIEKAVYEHNIIFIAAASNDGPALSTVRCPGGSLDACVSVGAYASADMLNAIYTVRDHLGSSEMTYSWTSRGPAPDGGLGVSVCAPGAAFTSVPNWTLQRSQLQHGTSMSTPNATGCTACLLSGLKYQNVLYSPISVKRTLENTARKQSDHEYFAAGHGVIQVEAAYDYLLANYRHLDSEIVYKVTVDGFRGVYLREQYQLDDVREMMVEVKPVFKDETDNSTKANFEKHFLLNCQCRWVECPAYFTLSNHQRKFGIKIHPGKLKTGTANYVEILASDFCHPDIGPLWRLPITVIKPHILDASSRFVFKVTQTLFKATQNHRYYIQAPNGAEWADFKLTADNIDQCHRFVLHTLQLMPDKSSTDTEHSTTILLSNSGEVNHRFPVCSGRTLEVCITKWWTGVNASDSKCWASPDDIICDLEISFRGLTPCLRTICMNSSDCIYRIYLLSMLKCEEVSPAVCLPYLCKPIKPTKVRITPLKSRDLFQDGRQIYESILHYDFKITQPCNITITFPSISDYLYESQLDGHFWMVFNKFRQFFFAGSSIPCRFAQHLPANDYVLLMQLRSDSKEMLERSKNMTLVLRCKLATPIQLDCYSSWACGLNKSRTFSCQTISTGCTVPLYISGAPDEKLRKMCTAGCYLAGSLTLSKNDRINRIVRFDFRYILDDFESVAYEKEFDGVIDYVATKSTKEKHKAAVRDLNLNWLSRLDDIEAEQLYEEIVKEYPDHLPLYQAMLKTLVEHGSAKNRERIVNLADIIISKIDQTALLEYFGTVNDLRSDANKIRNEMASKRLILIDSLLNKGLCIADFLLWNSPETANSALIQNVSQLKSFANANSTTTLDCSATIHDNMDSEQCHFNPESTSYIVGDSQSNNVKLNALIENPLQMNATSNSSTHSVVDRLSIDSPSRKAGCEPSAPNISGEANDFPAANVNNLSAANVGGTSAASVDDLSAANVDDLPTANVDDVPLKVDDLPAANFDDLSAVNVNDRSAANADDEPLSTNSNSSLEATVRELDNIFAQMMKFCQPTDPKVALFCVKHAVIHEHYGRALKYLKNLIEDKPSKELDTILIEIYGKLGWMHVVDYTKNWLLVKYPPRYRLF